MNTRAKIGELLLVLGMVLSVCGAAGLSFVVVGAGMKKGETVSRRNDNGKRHGYIPKRI